MECGMLAMAGTAECQGVDVLALRLAKMPLNKQLPHPACMVQLIGDTCVSCDFLP
jgi:hypothetical protein